MGMESIRKRLENLIIARRQSEAYFSILLEEYKTLVKQYKHICLFGGGRTGENGRRFSFGCSY